MTPRQEFSWAPESSQYLQWLQTRHNTYCSNDFVSIYWTRKFWGVFWQPRIIEIIRFLSTVINWAWLLVRCPMQTESSPLNIIRSSGQLQACPNGPLWSTIHLYMNTMKQKELQIATYEYKFKEWFVPRCMHCKDIGVQAWIWVVQHLSIEPLLRITSIQGYIGGMFYLESKIVKWYLPLVLNSICTPKIQLPTYQLLCRVKRPTTVAAVSRVKGLLPALQYGMVVTKTNWHIQNPRGCLHSVPWGFRWAEISMSRE